MLQEILQKTYTSLTTLKMEVAVSLKLPKILLISTAPGSKSLTLYGIQSGLTDRCKPVVPIRSAGITDTLAQSCTVLQVQCQY